MVRRPSSRIRKEVDYVTKKLSLVVIRTSKFDTTKAFYQEKVGLKLRFQEASGKWCHFDAGGIELGIQAVDGGHDVSQGKNSIYLTFEVEDIERAVAEMRTRGVEFTSGIEDNLQESFRQVKTVDPEGNKIVLFQRISS